MHNTQWNKNTSTKSSDHIPWVMKWYKILGFIQQTVPYRTATQTVAFSRLICLLFGTSETKYNRSLQKKLFDKKIHKISNCLFQDKLKKTFKILEIEKDEDMGRKKAMALKDT